MSKFAPADGTAVRLRVSFGASRLGGSLSPRASVHAVNDAFELGIRHFDVARSYGYGHAEAILAKALTAKRGEVWISSKYGIEPPSRRSWRTTLMPMARQVLKLAPFLRKSVQRVSGQSFQKSKYTAVAMRNSLETTLRELRTDYLDLFLLHDAHFDDLAGNEELISELECVRRAGKCRYIGLTTTSRELPKIMTLSDCLGADGPLDVLQTGASLVDQAALKIVGPKMRCFHSVLSGARVLQTDAELAPQAAQLALRWVMAEAPEAMIVVGMSTRAHIAEIVKAAQEPALDLATRDRLQSFFASRSNP